MELPTRCSFCGYRPFKDETTDETDLRCCPACDQRNPWHNRTPSRHPSKHLTLDVIERTGAFIGRS